MKALTIAYLSVCLVGCKITAADNPDQDILITGSEDHQSSKPELSQTELSHMSGTTVPHSAAHNGPAVVVSDDVVMEDINPQPNPQPVPQLTGPTKQAIANCQGYFPYDAKLLADGTVDLIYSWIVSGVAYPVVTGAWTHDNKKLWGIDLGNGRVDYFEEKCFG
jgi:hypothetical protein